MAGTAIDQKEKFTSQLYQFSNLVGRISFLRRIILNRNKNYHSFFIPKKRGLSRKIEEPSKDLKAIQRKILFHFFPPWKFSQHCHGFVSGRSIVTNSRLHVKKKVILKLDIKDFFPSIGFERVKDVFLSLGFNEQTANYFSELCVLDNHLPQGAPTSPALSNLVCKNLDKRLYYLAKKSDLNCSRYADDIVFSGDKIKRSLYRLIKKIIEDEGFLVNENKVFWANNQRAQKVTGIVVNDKASLGKKRYKRLAAFIHNCCYGDLHEQKLRALGKGIKIKDLKNYLYGMVSFIYSIDPEKAKRLRDKLDSIPLKKWEDESMRNERADKKDLYLEIAQLVKKINEKFNGLFFSGRIESFVSVTESLKSREQFDLTCIRLNGFIDQMKTEEIGKGVDKEHKPLENLEEWLNEKGYQSRNILEVFYDIKKISNNLSRHEDLKKISKVFKKYGHTLGTDDYEGLSLLLLKRLVASLALLNEALCREFKTS